MFRKQLLAVPLLAATLISPLQASPVEAAAPPRIQAASAQSTAVQWIDNSEFSMKIYDGWVQTPSFSGLGGVTATSPDGTQALEVNLMAKEAMSDDDIDTSLRISELLIERSLPMDCLHKEKLDYKSPEIVGKSIVWTGCTDVGSFALVIVSQIQGEQWTISTAAFSPDEEWKSFTSLAFESLTLIAAKALALTDLNIRSGPGTNYPRLNMVQRGTEMLITGQVQNCRWLRILLFNGNYGWVAGGRYVHFTEGVCVAA